MCESTAETRPLSVTEVALREKQQDEWNRQEALRQAVAVVGSASDPRLVLKAAADFHSFLSGR